LYLILHGFVYCYLHTLHHRLCCSSELNKQVLDWTTCLLDAQLSNIVMLPDAHVCLRDLTHLVCGQHLPLCEDIEHLRGVLKHFMHHGAVPLKPVLDYDVEVLFL